MVPLGKHSQPADRVRYHGAPYPLRSSYPTLAFADGRALITYGFSTMGNKDVIEKTYGIDYDELLDALGIGPKGRANKVRSLPIEWFFS